MYKMWSIDQLRCCKNDNNFGLTYTIWNFDYSQLFQEALNLFSSVFPCNAKTFSFTYWVTLLISIIGFVQSIREFISVYSGSKSLSTFRDRQVRVLPHVFRKHARLVGSFFMAKVHFLLFLGIISANPYSMMPWVVMQGCCFGLDVLLFFMDVIINENFLKLPAVFSLALFAFYWCLVKCVKNVFQNEVLESEVDQLQLLKIFN